MPLFEMLADSKKNQVAALRIPHGKMDLTAVAESQESVATKGEIEPGLPHCFVDKMEDLGVGKAQDVIMNRSPGPALSQTGEMARAVSLSLIQQYHAGYSNRRR